MKLAWISVPQVNDDTDRLSRDVLLKIPEAAQYFDGFIVIGPPFARVPDYGGVLAEIVGEVKRTGKALVYGRRLWLEWGTVFDVKNVYLPAWWARQLAAINAEALMLRAVASIAECEPYGTNKDLWKRALLNEPWAVAAAIEECGVQTGYVYPVGSVDPAHWSWALLGVGAMHCSYKTYKISDVSQRVPMNVPWGRTPRFDAWMSYVGPGQLTVEQAVAVWKQVEESDKYDTQDFIAYSEGDVRADVLDQFETIGSG